MTVWGKDANKKAAAQESGLPMALVVLDDPGRLTIPRKLDTRGTRAMLIPAGPFLIIVPIPSRPLEASASWLDTKLSRKELKALAEKTARKDALKRTKRKKQFW